MIGLEASEIHYAKKTVVTVITMFVIAGIFTLIGMYSARLYTLSPWYNGVSIRDFSIFSRFF